MIVVSACLCGINCKYSGKNNFNEKIYELVKEGKAIAVCPEVLGGLNTPRPPYEIQGGQCGKEVLKGHGKVVSKNNEDSTTEFIDGAYKVLKIVQAINPEVIVLKANSPSCGKGQIYDGSFNNNKVTGNGVTAELLLQNNYAVITEDEFNSKYEIYIGNNINKE